MLIMFGLKYNEKLLYLQAQNGSVAQLNRASDYGSEGWGFESLRSHKKKSLLQIIVYHAIGKGEENIKFSKPQN